MCFSFFKKNKKSELELLTERQDDKYDYSALDVLANYNGTKKSEEPAPAPKDYSFSLEVSDESSRGRSRTIYEPSEADIDEAVADLAYNVYNFLILDSANPINDCTYIQGSYNELQGERTVYVEIQHIEIRKGKKVWTNYYKLVSAEAFKGLLKEFLHKNTPSLYDWDELRSIDENGNEV